MRRLSTLLLLSAALAFAGCGGSSGDTTTARSATQAENQHELSKLPPKQQRALREISREGSN